MNTAPGQSWSILEGEGGAFLEDPYDLGNGQLGGPSFPNWFSLGYTGRFGATLGTLLRGWTEDN